MIDMIADFDVASKNGQITPERAIELIIGTGI